jgi:murein L,D-transpeptidase YafK
MNTAKEHMGKTQRVTGAHGYFFFFFACMIIIPVLLCGCSQFQVRSTFKEANDLFSQGNYRASLSTYEWIKEKYPVEGDRALFEMGIIYAFPRNEHKDYQKSLECFQKLIQDYPESKYRHDSERMIFQITNASMKDDRIAAQQELIKALQQEVKSKGGEVAALKKRIEALELKISSMVVGPADRVMIEKSERRLTLLSNGKILKTYKIALGGNPSGPKERQGDNKTPEGTYVIDSRNLSSPYHISLHLSYPNERDKERARKLGVPPGGDIMIHGIKNGFSMVGDRHTGIDWTKGCIAVTNEEIEEIEKLVPNGTIVDIKP